MKSSVIIFCAIVSVFFIISGCTKENAPTSPGNGHDNNDSTETVVRYVSPTGLGTETGKSKENAADFLDPEFWDMIRQEIANKSIKVQFLDGDYRRAYTDKPLNLTNIGDPDHKLILNGGDNVVFTLPPVISDISERKGHVISIGAAQNMVINGFHFTGPGFVGYIIEIGSSSMSTKNITVKNCSFINMTGVYYGAAGAHYEGTSYITFKNDTFKNVGYNSHAHFIYNAYGASHINIIDCYFENCTGDYVRFRQDDYCTVKGSTFIRSSDEFLGRVFIMMPVFNNVDPGDEYLRTHYAFVNNEFINKTSVTVENAISYYAAGYPSPGTDYLLTKEEGEILKTGTVKEKTHLLKENFDINPSKIRIPNNTFSSGIKRQFALQTYAKYGAASKGFEGTGDITGTISTQNKPFDWEP